MHRALAGHTPGTKPSLEDIVERLGAVSAGAQRLSENDGAAEPAGERGTGRRRGGRRRR
jgi:5-methyltetrahydrofolate--homocysteine methyltransferase